MMAVMILLCGLPAGRPAHAGNAPVADRIGLSERVVPPFGHAVFCQTATHGCRPVPFADGFAISARGVDHAVLVVRLDDSDVVLDNRTDAIRAWSKTPYRYSKIQSPDDPQIWYAIDPA